MSIALDVVPGPPHIPEHAVSRFPEPHRCDADGCHKFVTSVAMSVVVPAQKIFNPQAGLLLAGELHARIIRPVSNW